jgi:hypothetical protein
VWRRFECLKVLAQLVATRRSGPRDEANP